MAAAADKLMRHLAANAVEQWGGDSTLMIRA